VNGPRVLAWTLLAALGGLGRVAAASPPEPAPAPPEPPAAEPAPPSPSTHGRLRGTVFRWGSRDPVASVRVLVGTGATAAATETDREGTFAVWLVPGRHELLLRAEGMEDLRIVVEIERGQEQVFEYRMSENLDAGRYRTVVEGERAVAVSRITLREEEIHDVPGTRGDPFAVVKSLPGASQVAGFLPYVVVRGAAPGNTGYYLDGVRVPLLFHVAAGPSVIHPYFVDAVDFYLGGAPVRLGRFASGMVEGRTRPARRDRVHGDVDVRLTDAGALLEVPLHRPVRAGCDGPRRECRKGPARGALTVGGRYSYTGLVLSLIPQLQADIQFWDYQLRFDHDLGPRARYTAFAYGAYDSIGPDRAIMTDVDADGDPVERVDENPDPFLRLTFHRIDQRVRQQLRRGGDAEYMVALGFDQTGVDVYKTNVWRVMPRITVRLPVGANTEVGLGLDQDFAAFRVPDEVFSGDDADVEDIAFLLNERFVSSTGLWADLRWQKGIVELRPGIRGDVYAQVGSSPYLPQARAITHAVGIDPRFLVRERVAERVTLRQSLAVFHQPPDAPVPIPGIESLGFDRGLQRNVQAAFGYELRLGDAALLTQEAYLGRLDNLQDFELAASQDDPANEIEDYLIQVAGWAYGLETMLRLDPTLRVYGWVAYTLARSVRDFPVGGTVPGSWDQTHILNLVMGYRVGHKWRIGGRVHFNTGRPYTRVTDANARTAIVEGQPVDLLIALRDNRNNARLPPFFQFDLRVERIFRFKAWELHAFLDATNATLAREVFFCAAGDDPGDDGRVDRTTTDRYGCREPTALRYILPSIGIRARF
jgi:hypothetical protein